jgi:hypothetical protein
LRLCIYANLPTTLHLQFRPSTSDSVPPALPPRAISLRPSALPAARARPDGGGRSRTDANDDGDERRTRPGLGGDWREDLGWAATGGDLAWAATSTHNVRQNGAKGKNARARSVKKKFGGGVHTLGLPSLNTKSFGVGLFLDFANEFGTLQTTPNTKFICKVPWRCS